MAFGTRKEANPTCELGSPMASPISSYDRLIRSLGSIAGSTVLGGSLGAFLARGELLDSSLRPLATPIGAAIGFLLGFGVALAVLELRKATREPVSDGKLLR